MFPSLRIPWSFARTTEGTISRNGRLSSKSLRFAWAGFGNRWLTWIENLLIGAKLSEYHTGYRAFSRALLERLPLQENSDDFVFDNQMLAQIHWLGYTIAEITCQTKYFAEASSINLRRSLTYGVGCLWTALEYRVAKSGLMTLKRFPGSVTAMKT